MNITERIEGVCAHPAWLAVLSASMSGPANVAVTLCVLLRMLHGVEPARLLAAALAGAWARTSGAVSNAAPRPPREAIATPPPASGPRSSLPRIATRVSPPANSMGGRRAHPRR